MGGVPPPAAGSSGVVLRLVPIVPGQPRDLVVLAEAAWGVTTHWRPAGEWGPERTVGCSMPDRPCRWCSLKAGWSGYYPVGVCATGLVGALCVTADLDRQLRWRRGVRGNRPPLLGSKWRVQKARADRRSPLVAELLDADCRTFQASGSPDVRPLLRRLYPEIADQFVDPLPEGGAS